MTAPVHVDSLRATSPRPPVGSFRSRVGKLRLPRLSLLRGVMSAAAFVGVWAGVKGLFNLPDSAVPAPSAVADAASELFRLGILSSYLAETLQPVLIGVVTAAVVVVPVTLLIGAHPASNLATDRFAQFFLGVSIIAWLPLAVIWLGQNDATMIVVVAYSAGLPLLLNILRGLRTIPRSYFDALSTLGLSRRKIFIDVYLMGVMPSVISGIRAGVGFAWRAAIGVEMILSFPGLGFLIASSRQTAQPERIVVGMLTIGAVYIVLDRLIMDSIEGLSVGRWRE